MKPSRQERPQPDSCHPCGDRDATDEQQRDDAGSDAPVVADDEVVQERAQSAQERACQASPADETLAGAIGVRGALRRRTAITARVTMNQPTRTTTRK